MTAPETLQQIVAEIMDAAQLLASFRFFTCSREKAKQPEGTDLFDQQIERLRKTATRLERLSASEAAGGAVVPQIVSMIEQAGGRVDVPPTALPDGSGFMTASFPLPADHWLTKDDGTFDAPPMPFRMGPGDVRKDFADKIRTAARYAIRASTMKGKEEDFDPDAMVQNMIVGMLGYWSDDGLSSDEWANPNPVPPLYATQPPPRDAEREWQPIETAPKDEYVLVSCGPGGMIEACQPTEFVGKQYPWIDSYGNPVVGPEHWMPLPVPPRALAGGGT